MALNYSASTTLACTSFNSLASMNTTATAAASTAAATTSTSNNVVDAMVRVKVVTPAAYTPTASTTINVYVYGSEDGTNWPGAGATSEVLAGSDAAITLSSLGNNLRFLGTILCHTASGTFQSEPLSVASAFGGILPRKWAILVQNNLPATYSLAASGHSVTYTEIYYN